MTKETAAGSLHVLWGGARTFNGAPVTVYRGDCVAAGAVTKTFTAGATIRSTRVSGLGRNKAYLCKAQAVNKYGAGPYRRQVTCGDLSAKVNFDKPVSGIRLQSGRSSTVCGTGYLPHAHVALVLHSTPIAVGSITTDSDGRIDGAVSIPSTVPDGSHTLIASGPSANGTLTESAAVSVSYDITPPTLTGFTLAPAAIDTSSGDQTITVTATITDDLSGIGYNRGISQARFVSPSGSQFVDASFPDTNRTSGTPQNGVVPFTMTIPHFAEQGTWKLQYLLLYDEAGNSRTLTPTQLAALGYPTSFTNGP